MLLTALALSLLADVAPPPLPIAPKRPRAAQCRVDTDCRLSTFNGCCPGCCSPPPHAVPVGVREGEMCVAVDCARPDCSMVRCAGVDLSGYVAACSSGSCIAQPRQAECRVDADCRVVELMPSGCSGPCGCCPVNQAVAADSAVPLQRRAPNRPPQTPSGARSPETPKFGLSPGDTAGPPPPQCSPCPAPTPARAACQVGRCVLQPLEVPRPRPLIPG